MGNLVYKKFEHIEEIKGFKVVTINEKEGLLDSENRELIPCIYDEVEDIYQERFVVVFNDGSYGLYDIKLEKLAVPIMYENIDLISRDESSLVFELLEDIDERKCTLYNANLEKVIYTNTNKYCNYLIFREYDLIQIKKYQKHSIIDLDGNTLLKDVDSVELNEYPIEGTIKITKDRYVNYFDIENRELIFDIEIGNPIAINKFFKYIVAQDSTKVQVYDSVTKKTNILYGSYFIKTMSYYDGNETSNELLVLTNKITRLITVIENDRVIVEDATYFLEKNNSLLFKDKKGNLNFFGEKFSKFQGYDLEIVDVKGSIICLKYRNSNIYFIVNSVNGDYVSTENFNSIINYSGYNYLLKIDGKFNIYDSENNRIIFNREFDEIVLAYDYLKDYNIIDNNYLEKLAEGLSIIRTEGLYYCYNLLENKFVGEGYRNIYSVIGNYVIVSNDPKKRINTEEDYIECVGREMKIINGKTGKELDGKFYDYLQLYANLYIVGKSKDGFNLFSLYPHYDVKVESAYGIHYDSLDLFSVDTDDEEYEYIHMDESNFYELLVVDASGDYPYQLGDVSFESESDMRSYQRKNKK